MIFVAFLLKDLCGQSFLGTTMVCHISFLRNSKTPLPNHANVICSYLANE